MCAGCVLHNETDKHNGVQNKQLKESTETGNIYETPIKRQQKGIPPAQQQTV